MQSHLSNPWNNAVAYLAMFFGEQQLATGSCFFWGSEGRTFLVTNWHNLAGRNPTTDAPLSLTAGLPDRIAFLAYRRVTAPDAAGYFELNCVHVRVPLCEPDLTVPRWLEHPTLGRKVDVAAIDVTEAVSGLQIAHANVLENDAVLDLAASQDVFVVGFPFGLITNAPAPIWKRATVAMDPTFDVDGLPKMLVDTATREGMSGSVVVARHVVVGRGYPKKDGAMTGPVLYARLDLVAGVYSGRLHADLEKAQLGVIWKRRVIEEVITGKRSARVSVIV